MLWSLEFITTVLNRVSLQATVNFSAELKRLLTFSRETGLLFVFRVVFAMLWSLRCPTITIVPEPRTSKDIDAVPVRFCNAVADW
jgi:hypothetical protein